MMQVVFSAALLAGMGLSFTWLVQLHAEEGVQRLRQRVAAEAARAAEDEAAVQARSLEKARAAVAVQEAEAAAARAAVEVAQAEAEIAALPGDPAKGKMLYGSCMACHGKNAEGSRMFNSPRLAGQQSWYLKRQLKKFKERVRGAHPQDVFGMQMAPMVQLLYSDAAVDDAIAYMATLKPDKPAERGNGDAAAGKEHYQVCVACHGAEAQGNEMQKAPKLTGQHGWYLVKQIRNFREGVRGAHAQDEEGKLMGPIAKLLDNDKAIDDVVAYVQSLRED